MPLFELSNCSLSCLEPFLKSLPTGTESSRLLSCLLPNHSPPPCPLLPPGSLPHTLSAFLSCGLQPACSQLLECCSGLQSWLLLPAKLEGHLCREAFTHCPGTCSHPVLVLCGAVSTTSYFLVPGLCLWLLICSEFPPMNL